MSKTHAWKEARISRLLPQLHDHSIFVSFVLRVSIFFIQQWGDLDPVGWFLGWFSVEVFKLRQQSLLCRRHLTRLAPYENQLSKSKYKPGLKGWAW